MSQTSRLSQGPSGLLCLAESAQSPGRRKGIPFLKKVERPGGGVEPGAHPPTAPRRRPPPPSQPRSHTLSPWPQAAGNAVKRASDNLVKAAQKAAAFQDHENETVVVKEKMVGGIAQIIAAQEEMLRKERELEEARKKLAMIRQQQYKFLPSELRDEGQN
ncbi:UNVERIFIED_CONTAM: hypothetical protein K2H54_068381 [Gekko kuhli]